jgi:hypothetical protein
MRIQPKRHLAEAPVATRPQTFSAAAGRVLWAGGLDLAEGEPMLQEQPVLLVGLLLVEEDLLLAEGDLL